MRALEDEFVNRLSRHHLNFGDQLFKLEEFLSVTRIDQAKRALSQKMRVDRKRIHRQIGRKVARSITNQMNIARNLGLEIGPKTVVSSYWPVKDELDTRILMKALHEEKVICTLPIMRGKNMALNFRQWKPGDILQEVSFGVSEPTSDKPLLVPNIILLPLLAVDYEGNRLGYGGGYYDSTLLQLRHQSGHRLVAVGLAYEAQLIPNVPNDQSDAKIDWLVTEQNVYQFGSFKTIE